MASNLSPEGFSPLQQLVHEIVGARGAALKSMSPGERFYACRRGEMGAWFDGHTSGLAGWTIESSGVAYYQVSPAGDDDVHIRFGFQVDAQTIFLANEISVQSQALAQLRQQAAPVRPHRPR